MSEKSNSIFDEIEGILGGTPMSNSAPDGKPADDVAQIAHMHYAYWKSLVQQETSEQPAMPKELVESLTMMFASAHLHRIMCPSCNPPESHDIDDNE